MGVENQKKDIDSKFFWMGQHQIENSWTGPAQIANSRNGPARIRNSQNGPAQIGNFLNAQLGLAHFKKHFRECRFLVCFFKKEVILLWHPWLPSSLSSSSSGLHISLDDLPFLAYPGSCFFNRRSKWRKIVCFESSLWQIERFWFTKRVFWILDRVFSSGWCFPYFPCSLCSTCSPNSPIRDGKMAQFLEPWSSSSS